MLSRNEARRHALSYIRGRVQHEGLRAIPKERIAAWCEELEIPVTRTDGGDGDLRKSDYAAALGIE